MKFQKRQTKATPGDYSLSIVSLAEARLYLLATTGVTDQDSIITSLINAAVQEIEAGLDFAIDTSGLVTQYYDSFPDDGILPIWHRFVKSTDLVVQYWNDTTWATVAASNYRLDLAGTPPCVFLTSTGEWPDDVTADMNGVRVSFKVDTDHSFFDSLKAAVMTWVAARYENRENSNGIPEAVKAFIDRYKVHS